MHPSLPLLTLLVSAVACGGTAQQRLGRKITALGNVGGGHGIAWSADGAEIFYVSGTAPTIGAMTVSAARADGGGTRVVDGTKDTYGALAAAPDGSALYFVGSTNGGTVANLYEAFSQRLIASLGGGVGTLVPSPDNRHVALVDQRSVTVYDTTDGSAAPRLQGISGTLRAVAFAPTEDALAGVSIGSDNAGSVTVDRAGVFTATALPLRGFWAAASWSGAGLLVATELIDIKTLLPLGYRIDDVLARTESLFVFTYNTPGGSAWSPDGRTLVVSDRRCPDGSVVCDATRSTVDVMDVTTGQRRAIADADGTAQDIALSPDLLHVAYVLGDNLYVSDLTAP